jgi:hypothetical protein
VAIGQLPTVLRSRAWFTALGSSALFLALLAPANAVGQPPATSTPAGVDSDGDGLTDAFEIRWGVSDPFLADTDGNGLIDALEDPDHDGLSNLAEQRFGTDPGTADSDGNGIPDGLDDANGDGIPDHLEQDRRHVPAGLQPTLAHAPYDFPQSYADGCHTLIGSSTIHPCVYGDSESAISVAVFGDSHVAQWLPALIAAGIEQGWRVITLTKSGCPAADVELAGNGSGDVSACQAWRANAIAWLAANPPSLILTASAGSYGLAGTGGSQAATDAAWIAGWATTLDALPGASVRVLLADTRRNRVVVPSCLKSHLSDIAACETASDQGVSGHHNSIERQVALAHGAHFENLNPLLCSYDPCPIIAGNVLMWRDDAHLTATFSALLAPSLRDLVQRELGVDPAPGASPAGGSCYRLTQALDWYCE